MRGLHGPFGPLEAGVSFLERIDVLVVDDDELTLQISTLMLEDAGFTVATAKDGLEAISRLATAAFGLVVTDLEMPRLGGLGLIEWLRRSPSLSETPVVVLTGHTDDRTLAEILRHGADDYLTKPLRKDMLLEAAGRFTAPTGSALST